MVSINDVERIFLQSMVSRRVVSDKLARVLWGKCVEAVKVADDELEIPYDPHTFDQFINELNNRLEPLDLKLSVIIDEAVGKKLWVMINTKGDELAQVATDYSPIEIAYFRALVEQIVLASRESYSISSMTALREVSSLKPSMTKTQAEVVLASFVAKGWLLKSIRGRFSLSSRTLLELQTYLKNNYEEDIHECTLCFELITRGVRCHTMACGARLHDHCYQRFSRDDNACPSCRADWSQRQKLVIIGEGALKDGEDNKTRRKRLNDDSDDDDDEPEDTQGDEPEPVSKPSKKGKASSVNGKQRHVREEAETSVTSDGETEVEEEYLPKSQSRRRR